MFQPLSFPTFFEFFRFSRFYNSPKSDFSKLARDVSGFVWSELTYTKFGITGFGVMVWSAMSKTKKMMGFRVFPKRILRFISLKWSRIIRQSFRATLLLNLNRSFSLDPLGPTSWFSQGGCMHGVANQATGHWPQQPLETSADLERLVLVPHSCRPLHPTPPTTSVPLYWGSIRETN